MGGVANVILQQWRELLANREAYARQTGGSGDRTEPTDTLRTRPSEEWELLRPIGRV